MFTRKLAVVKQGGMIPTLFRSWKDWTAGEFLMGEFIETKWSMYQGKETPNHICKVIECNFKMKTKEGETFDPTGKVITLNSAGQLNKLLSEAQKGQTFQFVYDGKKRGTNPKDTQLYHTFQDLAIGWVNDAEQEEEESIDAL